MSFKMIIKLMFILWSQMWILVMSNFSSCIRNKKEPLLCLFDLNLHDGQKRILV